MKNLILTTALMALAAPVFAAGKHDGGHGDEMAVGMPGDAAQVDRTVELSMVETDDGEMLFEPRDLTFEKGETVRFVVTNTGDLEHELVLDTSEEITEHKALMEEFPEMEHDDPNAVRLEPGETGEIVWTFANDGAFEYACLIPGHYESGMHGPLVVN
ncbi:cupredoxin family protein [uncultured Jannaschia sp.]|uniref:cupredoxin domain-containing protein n=1 Tax=uncultured Jannaschia sp. TaxID=293347 RepID=UPI002631E4E1|nr:cupredoxin family protein [uncultured Jannaschia sp.]